MTTPNADAPYSDEAIERITDFGVEITPDEWVKEFNRLGRDEMASDYAIVYGLDFMANAPTIIRQLRRDLRAARAEVEAANANSDGKCSHQWYQKPTGELYCRHCATTITKSGKWLPPHAGWHPLDPEPEDQFVASDKINIGWPPPKGEAK